MNELVNDGIKLSKLEKNTGFINGLPKKWLSFCQSLRNINHVKDSKLASLFGKPRYEENLIDIIDDQMNSVINCLTAKSTWDDLILYHEGPFDVKESRDFQDSPDDEEDTRSSQEYLNDHEEEYQARALLAKSKRFFKKGTQRFSSTKATDQTECHKCGKKGHFTRDCWSKTLVSTYQSPFQSKPFSSPQHKHELRPTKEFEAKYNKVKAKLALVSSSALASKASMVKNKGLIAEAYEWDEEEVSSDDNEMVEYMDSGFSRHVTGFRSYLHKYVEQPGPKVVFGDDSTCTTEVDTPMLLSHKETQLILQLLSLILQRLIMIQQMNLQSHSNPPHCLSTERSMMCVDPISKPKTIKSILRSKSTFKAEALKSVIINEPSSAPTKASQKSGYNVLSRPIQTAGHQNASFHLAFRVDGIDHLSNECLYYPIFEMGKEEQSTLLTRKLFINAPRLRDVIFYINNHKDHIGKFDEKADDGYLLGYSLVSKAFRVFNTKRKQTKETYHITFDESPEVAVSKSLKPCIDDITVC
ncbi:retrovirus-related pol polyprotein from transposon TNT 1-94 [Tanacetum coccineum]